MGLGLTNEQGFAWIFGRQETGQGEMLLHKTLSEEPFRRGEGHSSLAHAAPSSPWLILKGHQQDM